jgi:hypothetical protein
LAWLGHCDFCNVNVNASAPIQNTIHNAKRALPECGVLLVLVLDFPVVVIAVVGLAGSHFAKTENWICIISILN